MTNSTHKCNTLFTSIFPHGNEAPGKIDQNKIIAAMYRLSSCPGKYLQLKKTIVFLNYTNNKTTGAAL